MKAKDVPQDKSSLTDKNMRELCYATDTDGNYVTKLSKGWEPKIIALNKSLDLLEERALHFKDLYKKGRISPIPYYMELSRMDLSTTASYMGKWNWQIKRHFKPRVFRSLSQKTLEKYATTFQITTTELTDIKD
ncbi:MAG: hypothetical protein JKY08_04735 [Flavobacteriaceae bacterium]|nr:hypothetical protein [Flavobacteriaceae bacterium]